MKRFTAAALLIAGLVLFGEDLFIHAKALLAQLVLSTRWPFDAVTPGPLRYLLHAMMMGVPVAM